MEIDNIRRMFMSIRAIMNCSVAVIAGCAFLSASWLPASAMTLVAPSPAQHFASSKVEKVWWCRWGCGWGWRRGWGWGPAVAGGVVAGAAVGAAVASSRPAYAYPYGSPCWRRAYDAWGRPYWRQMC
jgi:hypothetical protein